ncbi:tRNA lysidine(34) synthetase TilS [Rickettsiella endosymbiont of Dermanyssus gallinae]|uniref:tRNA lysidine(34) synthetase TilS n=1 Tax=Rickettsiella endosymbiont of Dermanyssus gallinae TaxID=2856608 RepID=UPI001C532472|nr:tRNA lysidine(34) synthetase TilS [Rickettsiella endosymbiont of Dermanyssus gallinae]
MFNPEKLLILLDQYPQSIFWVAYSGGLDSQVLLHALSQLVPTSRLRAIHINHGWHSEAAQWADKCQRTCAQLGIHSEVIAVDAQPKQGESPEAYARQVRYAAMGERLGSGDCLLTAHHRDDQAETLLLQSLRGAGLRGLASMSEAMPFANGFLVRPLLQCTRAELQAYAEAQQLTWVEDSSNTDLRFNRNFMRHQVLPLIQQRWPEASKTLARVAENAAEAHQLLEALAYEDLIKVRDPQSNNILVSHLLHLTPPRRRNCLRYWLKQLHFPLPTQMQLQQIEFLLESKGDANPQVNWGGVQVRRYRDLLYPFILKENKRPSLPVAWDLHLQQAVLPLPPLGFLMAERTQGQGISCESIKAESVTINFRQGGERFHLQGRLGSHPLKKLFQEWAVPPWQREKIPLIYYKEQLIAVAGYGINPNYLAKPNELGYIISLKSI